jgi:hypothetical protein
MWKWTLVICAALLANTQADARVHRGRPRVNKIFAANSQSVLLENQAADEMGAFRYFTQAQVDEAVLDGTLEPLYNHSYYIVSPKLPPERRYALPATVSFVETLSLDFYRVFHQPLMVDSAIRPATVQRSLIHRNRAAAPAYGNKASSHERGTTADFSKRMSKEQYRWMLLRLLYYRAIGRVLVIQERACWHVMVIS